MSDNKTCPTCGKKHSSNNFQLFKCDNCQTVTCPACKKGYDTCQVCRKGKNKRIR